MKERTCRILYLIKGLGRGGAELLVASAARLVDRSRFTAEVAYLLPWKDALVGELRDAGIPVHCVDGLHGGRWIPRIARLLHARRIDLLHVHSPYVAIGARAVARHRPLVYTEHNVWERYDVATRWANLLTYPLNDHVFAVSNRVGESIRYPRLLKWLPMPPVETLYHGPEVGGEADHAEAAEVREELGIPLSAPVVGTVANLKAHKGYRTLLEAARVVRRSIPDVRFVVVGRGPMEAELRRYAHELSLDGNVVFTGFRDDPLHVATAFDAFALASTYEGLSIALIEAMALGKASVVTRVGGLPEVLRDGQEGFLVPARDPAALADRLVALLRDEPLRTRMGAAAVLRARTFDMRLAVSRMETLYAELVR